MDNLGLIDAVERYLGGEMGDTERQQFEALAALKLPLNTLRFRQTRGLKGIKSLVRNMGKFLNPR